MTTSNILDFTFGEIEEKKKNRKKCQIMLTSAKGFPMCVLILPFQKNRNLDYFSAKYLGYRCFIFNYIVGDAKIKIIMSKNIPH